MPKTTKQNSIFFKFVKIGTSIEGTFAGFTSGKYSPVLQLKVKDKTVPVGLSNRVLFNLMNSIRNKVKAGDKLAISYTGNAASGFAGQPTHLFEVKWNGKLVESAQFQKLEGKAVDEAFEDAAAEMESSKRKKGKAGKK